MDMSLSELQEIVDVAVCCDGEIMAQLGSLPQVPRPASLSDVTLCLETLRRIRPRGRRLNWGL